MPKVNRNELVDALKKLKPAVSTTDDGERGRDFIFSKDDGGIAWSFNNEVAISHPLPTGFHVEGSVNADTLLKFLMKVKAKEITIEAVEEEIQLTSGKSKAGLALSVPTIDVSQIAIPDEDSWVDLPKEFIRGLDLVSQACSKDTSEAALSCVFFNGADMIGCDGFQLTAAYLPKKLFKAALIPASTVKHLTTFNPTAFSQSEDWFHFINDDDVTFSCRVAHSKYPDTAPLLAIEGSRLAFPEGLGDALDRAGVFAQAEFAEDEEVNLEADGKGTLLVKASTSGGWVREEMEIVGKPSFKFKVNPLILQQALELDHEVTIGESALLIEGADFKHTVSLI